MRGKREVGAREEGRREPRSCGKEEEKVKEQQEKGNCSLCSAFKQNDYSSQATQFWRALRKAVRNPIIKKKRKRKQNHTF